MQRIAANTVLFTVAMLLMFHPVGAKFSPNFNTLGEKWAKLLSQWNIRLCWHEKGWIVWQWANLVRQQMKSIMEVCFNSLCFDYVEFMTLEGRWRCCSVCQQSEVSHCSPRRTDWTSLVSDAILVRLHGLFVVSLIERCFLP